MNIEKRQAKIMVLYKYYAWADTMKGHLQKAMEVSPDAVIGRRNNNRVLMYLTLWYGMLSIVIQGWKRVPLHHNKTDKLLGSPNARLFKTYRKEVFKLSLNNNSNKHHEGLLFKGLKYAPWANRVHEMIGRQLQKCLWSGSKGA